MHEMHFTDSGPSLAASGDGWECFYGSPVCSPSHHSPVTIIEEAVSCPKCKQMMSQTGNQTLAAVEPKEVEYVEDSLY